MTRPARERQSLATGFRNVDESGDTDACTRCLDLIAGIPFFHQIKRDSIRIIADAGAERVLDAGCGAGADLAALSSALCGTCEIVGLDASGALLGRALERTAGFANRCSLARGDILNNPFRNGSFGACRIDRVLQHIHEPDHAIRELARILAPGGVLVAFDNDWDTFSLSLDDRETAAQIRLFWRNSFASGRVGRDLPRLFREHGIAAIHADARTLELRDLRIAEQVFDLNHLLERMIVAGILEPDTVSQVRNELRERSLNGTFSSGYTGFLVWGTTE